MPPVSSFTLCTTSWSSSSGYQTVCTISSVMLPPTGHGKMLIQCSHTTQSFNTVLPIQSDFSPLPKNSLQIKYTQAQIWLIHNCCLWQDYNLQGNKAWTTVCNFPHSPHVYQLVLYNLPVSALPHSELWCITFLCHDGTIISIWSELQTKACTVLRKGKGK